MSSLLAGCVKPDSPGVAVIGYGGSTYASQPMLLAFVYRVVYALFRLILTRGTPLSVAEIELLVLRHERRVLPSRAGGATWRAGDRLWLTALSRCLPGSAWHVFPVNSITLRRHREIVRRRWAAVGSGVGRRGRRSPLRCVS